MNRRSLELFSKCFSNADLPLGCDIDAKCKKLRFDEPNIQFAAGDVNNEQIKHQIIQHSKFSISL